LPASFKYLKELYYALAILLSISVLGVLGFMFIEGYSFSEALYMTVITVSTVGFQEVRTLTDSGRYFTIFLILVSFGTFAFALSSLSKYIINGTFQRYYKKYKMDSRIQKLEGHIVLCGAGRNGMESLQNLLAYGQEVVIIESNEDIAGVLQDKGLYYIKGDATEEESLKMAGIESASALITALPRDTDNVFVVLTARELNTQIKIVSRCTLDSSESKLKIAGANVVIMPDKVGGERMAGFVINQNINRFIDSVSLKEGGTSHLFEIEMKHFLGDSQLKTIDQIIESLRTECKIVGIMSKDFSYMMNPSGNHEPNKFDNLFFFGTKEQILNLKKAISP